MRYVVFIAISVILTVSYINPLRAELIFWKDGRITEVKVISDGKSSIVVRRIDAKNTETVKVSDILRIVYTDLYLGKVYIRMSSGEIRQGYIVDEDTTQYIVRNDLSKPEEYAIPRAKVIFIARSNPTDLTGSATFTAISLKWSEPFIPGEKYRVYIREKSSPSFRMAMEVKKNYVTIEDLSRATGYILYVTSVDADGKESVPSEHIKMSTLNTPPSAPRGIQIKTDQKGSVLSWPPSEDIDGTIQEYVITVKNASGEFIPLGSTKEPVFRLMKKDISGNKTFRITAIDNAGAASDPASFTFSDGTISETVVESGHGPGTGDKSRTRYGYMSFRDRNVFITFNPAIMYPFGVMGKVYLNGFGQMLSFNAQNFILANFETGLETGVMRFAGKQDRVKEMIMVPVMTRVGYRFILGDSFSIVPSASAGGVFMSAKYTDAAYQTTRSNVFEAAARISVSMDYILSSTVYLTCGAGYTFINESKGNQRLLNVNAGAGFRAF